MPEKSNSNSTLIIFMLGGVGLAMCACVLLGAFMFVGFNVNAPDIAIDPVIEPNIEEQPISNASDESEIEGTSEIALPTENAPLDIDSGTSTSVFDLQEGSCFNDPVEEDEDLVDELTVVSCNSAHDNEVYAIVTYQSDVGADFPGDERVKEFADEECESAYFSYVGIDYAESLFLYSTYYPSDESWGNGDREIICFLYHPDLEKLTDTLKGSHQ